MKSATYVTASRISGIFNVGGDLALFAMLIKAGDRAALEQYAKLCIDNIYPRTQAFFSPALTKITLVQGDALGGGFECALAADVIVAEESAQMGLPEILFNLFPGMGAYSLLRAALACARPKNSSSPARSCLPPSCTRWASSTWSRPTARARPQCDWIAKNARRRNGLQALCHLSCASSSTR